MVSSRVLTVVVTCALLVGVTAAPAAAEDQDRADDAPTYLALGDSVAFGFNPLLDAIDPSLDNGCRSYRAAFPLHVSYNTSQLDFAIGFLKSHPHTRLVTLDVGANDLLLLQAACAGNANCVANGLPGLLTTLRANLTTIYGRIRGEAQYRHSIVGLMYYALDYTDPVSLAVTLQIDATVAQATFAARGRVADGFGEFAIASGAFGGSPCAAGLLIPTPGRPAPCDVHPSPAGRDLLADAIADVLDEDLGD
jgi:lysophospholipase L1-like esterase